MNGSERLQARGRDGNGKWNHRDSYHRYDFFFLRPSSILFFYQHDILILLKLREKFISLRFPRSSDSICKFAPPGTNETPCKKSTKVTRDLLRVVRSLKISSYQVRSPFIPTNGSYLPPVSPSIFLPISSQNIK